MLKLWETHMLQPDSHFPKIQLVNSFSAWHGTLWKLHSLQQTTRTHFFKLINSVDIIFCLLIIVKNLIKFWSDGTYSYFRPPKLNTDSIVIFFVNLIASCRRSRAGSGAQTNVEPTTTKSSRSIKKLLLLLCTMMKEIRVYYMHLMWTAASLWYTP